MKHLDPNRRQGPARRLVPPKYLVSAKRWDPLQTVGLLHKVPNICEELSLHNMLGPQLVPLKMLGQNK
jgi:hypothetical protein